MKRATTALLGMALAACGGSLDREAAPLGKLVLALGNPPQAASVAIQPSAPHTGDALAATYTYFDAEGDAEAAPQIQWSKDGVVQAAFGGLLRVPAGVVQRNESWGVCVTPNDGSQFGATVCSARVSIANAPPVASQVALVPATPRVGQDLSLQYVYTDADADPEAGSVVRWTRDGAEVPALAGSRLVSSTLFIRGQSWRACVTPRDGITYGAQACSGSVTIANTPPVAANVAITPAAPVANDALSARYAFNDVDGDAESGSVYRWLRDGLDMPQLNQALVPAGIVRRGERWSFCVIPSDGTDAGAEVCSASIVIGNRPPVASNVRIDPAVPTVLQGLTVVYDFFDAEGDAESGTQIDWLRNGVEQMPLANMRAIPAGTARKGEVWSCVVTPSDGHAAGSPVVCAPVTIGNSPPVANAGQDQRITPNAALTRVTLDGAASSDPDGDLLSFAWWEGARQLAQGSRASIDLPVGQHLIQLQVNDGSATAVDEVAIGIADPAPTVHITSVTAPPGWVQLVADAGDSLARPLSYAWTQIAGPPVNANGLDADTLSFFALSAGRYVFQCVVATEGGASASATGEVTISNVAPFAWFGGTLVAFLGEPLVLDGSHSNDPNGSPLMFRWASNGGLELSGEDQDQVTIVASAGGTYTVSLIVNDGELSSTPYLADVLVIDPTLRNHAPVANAGPDQFGEIAKALSLDAGDSYDLDGDRLSFQWSQRAGPPVAIASGTGGTFSFTPPSVGEYEFELVAEDGAHQSLADAVRLSVTDPQINSRPIARAGDSYATRVGLWNQLYGLRSADMDGDALTYTWRQVHGPAVTLANESGGAPNFTSLRPGLLRFELTVSDGRGLSSAPSYVEVAVTGVDNEAPQANAGQDQIVLIGSPVELDGSRSLDPDGDALTYHWTQLSGTPAPLQGADSARPRFVPVGSGTYRFELRVSDGETLSFADAVTIKAGTHNPQDNKAPTAVVTPVSREVWAGELVPLSGSASSDPDPLDVLSYRWTLASVPAGASTAALSATDTVDTMLAADIPGEYVVELVVSDGDLESAPARATVVVKMNEGSPECGCTSGASASGSVGLVLLALGGVLGRRSTRTF